MENIENIITSGITSTENLIKVDNIINIVKSDVIDEEVKPENKIETDNLIKEDITRQEIENSVQSIISNIKTKIESIENTIKSDIVNEITKIENTIQLDINNIKTEIINEKTSIWNSIKNFFKYLFNCCK